MTRRTLGLTERLKIRVFPALGEIEHHFGLRMSYPSAAAMIDRIEAATAAGRIQAILDRHA
jgi:hypothetical protein